MSRNRFMGGQKGGLRITKGRVPKWEANWWAYRLDGTRFRRNKIIGIAADMSEPEARKLLAKLIAEDNRMPSGILAELTGVTPSTFKPGERSDGKQIGGALGEMAVMMDLMSKGWEVFRPISLTTSCDLIAIKGPETLRFEVKSATVVGISNPRFRCDLRRNLGKFDVAAIVVFSEGTIHYIPKHELSEPSRPPVSLASSSLLAGAYQAEAS